MRKGLVYRLRRRTIKLSNARSIRLEQTQEESKCAIDLSVSVESDVSALQDVELTVTLTLTQAKRLRDELDNLSWFHVKKKSNRSVRHG